MTKKRIGKNPLQKPKDDSIFKPSDEKSKTLKDTKNRGRPIQHGEKWTKVTCVLFNSQIAWLDHLAADIRLNTGAAIFRAELIRAILGAIHDKGIDLTEVTSEQDAMHIISSHMK